MNSWLRAQIREKYGSNTGFARALRKRVKVDLKEASLATEVGRLVAGQDGWWRKRSDVTLEAADLLECEVVELLGAQLPASDSHALVLTECPLLRPLRIGEEPSLMDGAGWLASEITHDAPHRWVVAPAGAGKSLVIRYLQQRDGEGGPCGAFARTLGEAQHVVHSSRPVVVEIEHADAGDRDAFLELGRKVQPLTVFAAFDPPVELTHDSYVGSGAWQVRRWRPGLSWRHRFLHWIAERIPKDVDHLFDLGETQMWLNVHDPDHELVATPGELLALCSIAMAVGLIPSKSLASLAKPWLNGLAASMSVPSDDARVWLRRFGARAVRDLVGRSFEAPEHALHDIDAHGWAALLDDGEPRTRSALRLRKSVDEIANEGNKSQRRQKAEKLSETLAQGTTTEEVLTMAETGILRGAGNGGYALFPRWAAEALRQEHIQTLLTRGDVSAWSAVAADPDRQRCIDGAVANLSTKAFVDLVERVVATFDRNQLWSASAVEACFADAGRRLAAHPDLHHGRTDAFQQLGRLQVGLLVRDADGEPLPVTRMAHQDAVARWLASSWPFSMSVPRPKGLRLSGMDWHFPGWAQRLSLTDLPQDMPSSHGATQAIQAGGGRDWYAPSPSRMVATDAVRMIAQLSTAAISRCRRELLPDKPPRILLPAIVLDSTHEGWIVTDDHLRQLRSSWEEEYLVEQLRDLHDDARSRCVNRIWMAMVREPQLANLSGQDLARRVESFQRDLPLLATAVLESIDPDVFTDDASTLGFGTHPEVLRGLPKRLRSAALRTWAQTHGRDVKNLTAIRKMLTAVSEDDIDLLLKLAGEVESGADTDYFAVVWRHAPERALQGALSALETRSPQAKGWCWSAPSSAIPHLVSAMEGAKPDWIVRWALRRLPESGLAAQRLYRLSH